MKPLKVQRVVKLIRKSNDLVEAKYRFDIWETRLFTKMLTLVRPDDEDFANYRIFLKEVVDEYNVSSNKDAYARLKEAAQKLMSRIITLQRSTPEG